MITVIDGHNLIPKIPGLSLLQIDDENQLIDILREFSRLSRRKLEVYFDGAPIGYSGDRMDGMVRVVFVSEKTTADEEIINRIRRIGKRVKEFIVVSSDHHVQNQVRSLGAKTITSDQFVKELFSVLNANTNNSDEIKRERQLSDDEIQEWIHLFNSAPPEKYSDKD
ncbi:NYN domain-containing protein [Flexilinea flocculi]|jgi:predicted RNA-binding protein with PIN domain|uniref:Predicted RNA-binding protein containing a PIN domain n=1 Tax=Flexilinea flocculi TaxID=1678840 RepID=A0A0S7BM57_9CHLR|nr:NYN domain-containing protein [Flexilinea flocculi]NMB93890.1 NYN domain-containing protein [Flexilinea flocculi]GAP41436.1 predicted RNA-binding protein containing a PIN domain [Flexilinea flocculi]